MQRLSCYSNSRGVFKEAAIYTFNDEVFAKVGNGYIRLYANNSTSTKARVHEIIYPEAGNFKFKPDKFNRLILESPNA